jgi:sec-independent protein translocase protein TatB
VFGLSFGEIVLLLLIAIVVVGPRELPSLLRTIGEFIGRARRMATDLRAESGIDEILRDEGIQSEIDNFRRLAAGVDLSAATPKYDYPPPPSPEQVTIPEGTTAQGILTETAALPGTATEAVVQAASATASAIAPAVPPMQASLDPYACTHADADRSAPSTSIVSQPAGPPAPDTARSASPPAADPSANVQERR